MSPEISRVQSNEKIRLLMMHDYQAEFIEFAIAYKVLRFGEFTLKSGRKSPYFFNSGLFNDGRSLSLLGQYYAKALKTSAIEYDMVFGPAYKGIPLGSALSVALDRDYGENIPYCFNRKEAKDHGEGGITMGAELKGKVVIVDDVISAGTSVNISCDIIQAHAATPSGVLIAVDRQERGQSDVSAVEEVKQKHGLEVQSIITLANLIEYLQSKTNMAENLQNIQLYRETYGTKI